EVTFQLVGGSAGCGSPGGLRDKTASLSVSTFDSHGNLVFPPLKNVEGNKFHWDSKNSVNEYDISIDGLGAGIYYLTLFSSKFSPTTGSFCVTAGVVTCKNTP